MVKANCNNCYITDRKVWLLSYLNEVVLIMCKVVLKYYNHLLILKNSLADSAQLPLGKC